MQTDIAAAVLHRGNHRCAWCACKLGIVGVVCRLDVFDAESSFVASCRECAGEYAKHWPYAHAYSAENAKRFLGRCPRTQSGPFVDYLESVCGFHAVSCGRMSGKRSGLYTPFSTALARVEAQRNAPLDVRRKGRAA